MSYKFEKDKKEHEYRCYKDGEFVAYIYERYEPTNPRKRRNYFRVKDVIFYKLEDAKRYVKLLYGKSDSPQNSPS